MLAASIIKAIAMEVASASETSVNVYQTTKRNIPEDHHLHSRSCSIVYIRNKVGTYMNRVLDKLIHAMIAYGGHRGEAVLSRTRHWIELPSRRQIALNTVVNRIKKILSGIELCRPVHGSSLYLL
jgi:hypothetical protein